MTIAFAGLYEDDNLGDPVIAHCTEQLYLQGLPREYVRIRHVSLNHYCFHPASWRFYGWLRLSGALGIHNHEMNARIIAYDYVRYFDRELRDVDAVIIVGGGLIEFTGGRFIDGMYAITRAGNKYGFPVIINASGVEGYDAQHAGCRKLKDMLHQPSLKYVSTRDDYDTLFNKYFDGKPTTRCEKVADPAVWAAEIYGVKRDNSSKVVGLGVIRSNIFENYGHSVSPLQLRQLYMGIIHRLQEAGEEVHLFTNGTRADNEFLEEIVAELRKEGMEIPADIPATDRELIETLSRYKGVIAGRLHSCIISYSLGIPAIGLVWNEKLSLFGQDIGCAESFFKPEQFDAAAIVERLRHVVATGYDKETRDRHRQTILDSVESNRRQYLSKLA